MHLIVKVKNLPFVQKFDPPKNPVIKYTVYSLLKNRRHKIIKNGIVYLLEITPEVNSF